jgi:hypothetical protein
LTGKTQIRCLGVKKGVKKHKSCYLTGCQKRVSKNTIYI